MFDFSIGPSRIHKYQLMLTEIWFAIAYTWSYFIDIFTEQIYFGDI